MKVKKIYGGRTYNIIFGIIIIILFLTRNIYGAPEDDIEAKIENIWEN